MDFILGCFYYSFLWSVSGRNKSRYVKVREESKMILGWCIWANWWETEREKVDKVGEWVGERNPGCTPGMRHSCFGHGRVFYGTHISQWNLKTISMEMLLRCYIVMILQPHRINAVKRISCVIFPNTGLLLLPAPSLQSLANPLKRYQSSMFAVSNSNWWLHFSQIWAKTWP